MRSIEETGKRDSGNMSELYLYSQLKYLNRMPTVTGNWIGNLVIKDSCNLSFVGVCRWPVQSTWTVPLSVTVCAWITAIVSLTEQKANLIQIKYRVVRALAPASSQNYSRSSTQSDLLKSFSFAFETPCPS